MFEIPTPADLDPAAKPYDAKPSAAVMSKTSDAIEALLGEAEVSAFEPGIYWVDRTVSVNGAATQQTRRQIHFHLTELRAAGPLDAYTAVRSEGDGSDLDGLNDSSDNIPTGETTRILLDVTNSNYSCYQGAVTINCGGMNLAGIGATNRHRQNGAGGIGSTWETVIITKGRWGMFGTPRYGQQRQYYAGAFVGNIWKRLRILECDMPLLLASNTGDDQHIGELNIINPPGGRSYLYAINLNLGSAYLGGHGDQDYCLDIQKASINCGSLYAEGDFATPIIMRDLGLLVATPKYGGGASTTFRDRAFVTHEGKTGGGYLWVQPTTAASQDVEALVALAAVSGSTRDWVVQAPFSEGELKPYKAMGSLSGKDSLVSHFAEGGAQWTGANLERASL